MCFIAIAASVVLPDAKQCNEDSSPDDSNSLNVRGILKVLRTKIMALFKFLSLHYSAKNLIVCVLCFSRHV